MIKTIDISIDLIRPDATGVLASQGVPRNVEPPKQVKKLYDSAEELFLALAAPAAVMREITADEFAGIYTDSGNNAEETPLETIFPKARHIALFAFTLGPEISNEIEEQFKTNGLALGYMLDAVASYCTAKASEVAEQLFLELLQQRNQAEESTRVLHYSPGYCGWHISGQSALFRNLEPERIGMSLNDSFLMIPLKSISGVMVAGDAEMHRFKNRWSFCADCKTKSCLERIERLG
ncbi:MAG: hypothetical protein GY765_20930 [bacterium]|nr:hypothetical protein [bacterium]